MKKKETRAYNSTVRQKQAEDTKNRIADAAEEFIKSAGYEHTTIGEIAQKAGVATQTVYSVFNSKQGILIYLLKRALKNTHTDVDYKTLAAKKNIIEVTEELAGMFGRKGKEHISIFKAMGGDHLYPEMSELIHEANERRRNLLLEGFKEFSRVQSITIEPAKEKILIDIFWALTDNCIYYMLVECSDWPYEYYERFLAKILQITLSELTPEILKIIEKTPCGQAES